MIQSIYQKHNQSPLASLLARDKRDEAYLKRAYLSECQDMLFFNVCLYSITYKLFVSINRVPFFLDTILYRYVKACEYAYISIYLSIMCICISMSVFFTFLCVCICIHANTVIVPALRSLLSKETGQ